MRELDAMLRAIDQRRHNEISVQASFHGIRIPIKGEPVKPVNMTEAESSAMEKALQEARLRKAKEFERRHG